MAEMLNNTEVPSLLSESLTPIEIAKTPVKETMPVPIVSAVPVVGVAVDVANTTTGIPPYESPVLNKDSGGPSTSPSSVIDETTGDTEIEDHDSPVSDSDSAIGSSIRDSTRSITDSVFSSIEENGRLYHSFKDGKYVLPNDEQEQARLDLQHHLFGLTLDGKLTIAPIEETRLHNVLDVGTGTGIWAIEFASEHPETKVIGIDLSAVQPSLVPPNLEFQICDAEEEWNFSTKFDYVHWRMMGICFRDFKEVFRHAFNALAPGGIIECQDCSFPMKSDDGSHVGTAIDQWFGYVLVGMEKMGKSFGTEPKNYKKYLEEVGFVDVHVDIKRWPVGPWMEDRKNKELGLWVRADGLDVMQGGSLAILTRGMGWSPQQVEVFLVDCRKAFMDKSIHGYMDVYFVWARKPE